MEMKEKISLMLKAALEYNSAIVAQAVTLHAIKSPDRKTQRESVKEFRRIQSGYMKQLDRILTDMEVEVS